MLAFVRKVLKHLEASFAIIVIVIHAPASEILCMTISRLLQLYPHEHLTHTRIIVISHTHITVIVIICRIIIVSPAKKVHLVFDGSHAAVPTIFLRI